MLNILSKSKVFRYDILFISHESVMYGAPNSLSLLAQFYASCNIDCRCLTYGNGDFVEEMLSHGIKVGVIPVPHQIRVSVNTSYFRSLIRFFLDKYCKISEIFIIAKYCFSSKIIYINTIVHTLPFFIAKLFFCKTVIHVRESSGFFNNISFLRRNLMKAMLKHANHVFVVSEDTERIVLDFLEFKKSPSNISVINNGVDTSIYRFDANLHSQFREKYNIRKNKILVGFVGALTDRKGIDVFLEAAEILKLRYDIDFIVCGGSPEGIENIKSRHNIKDNKIIFTGFIRNTVSAFCSIDVFVMCSREEPFGRVSLEASACGCAVISSDIPGTREVFREAGSALFIKENTPEDLAKAICFLAEKKVERDVLSINARKNIEKNFSLGIVHENHFNIMKNIFRKIH